MQSNVRFSMIAAVARNGAIGINGGIPWRLKEDFRYFKEKTMGKPIIMGRKTWESLPKMLPGRWHIVVSSALDLEPPTKTPPAPETASMTVTPFFNDAIAMATSFCIAHGLDEFFVIGGAKMYEEGLKRADRLYITEVHMEPDADTFFPIFGYPFVETSRTPAVDQNEGIFYDFVVFDRK